MVCLALATPVAKTCDAGGARLGRSGGSGRGRIIGRISFERVPLRMPPSATFALLPSRGQRGAVSGDRKQMTYAFVFWRVPRHPPALRKLQNRASNFPQVGFGDGPSG